MPGKPDPYAFKNSDLIGEVVPPGPRMYARYALLDESGRVIPAGPDPIPLDVWAHALDPDTRKPTGYLGRVRMRSLGEVFADLEKALDLVVCDRCGHEEPRQPGKYAQKHTPCGGDLECLIDEYLHGPDCGKEHEPVPHDFRWVACFPVTGGSEGHYVHASFFCPVGGPVPDGEPNVREVRLALARTFRGLVHAAEIARRCALLLGA